MIELARHLPDVPVGAVIEVLSDDDAARLDVPAWCRMRGQEYVGERAADARHGLPRAQAELSAAQLIRSCASTSAAASSP